MQTPYENVLAKKSGSKVSGKGRIPVADILDGIVDSKAQISGATFIHA